jgi:hypothetical protein
MSKYHLMNVRILPISIIADRWSEEAEIERSIIEQELRLSVLNRKRFDRGLELLPHIPAEKLWPSATERLDREHIEWFCTKQKNWPLPEFWFGKQIKEKGKSGRPPLNRDAIVQEFRSRRATGLAHNRQSEEARHLSAWFRRERPNEKPPADGTIQNWIRAVEKELQLPPQN